MSGPRYIDDDEGRVIRKIFSFTCDDCCRSYSSREKLSRHRRDKHGPQLQCYHCGREFAQSRKWALRDHTKVCRAKFQTFSSNDRRYDEEKNKQYSHQKITNPDTSRYSSTYATTKTSSTPTTTTAFSTTTNRTEDANEFARSPENPVDLSGDVPMMYSPIIQTFSIFDQNDVMNCFTNLSVPEERQSQTPFLSQSANYELSVPLTQTTSIPSDSTILATIEDTHPTRVESVSSIPVSLQDQTMPTITAVTSASLLTIPQLPIGQQIFQIETIGGTVPVHVVNMEGLTEQMLPENQDVTVSETPYINTEPVITAPASTSTISTYTNTHPYPSVSLWATPTCTLSRSQTTVPPKEIEQGPVQMPGKGYPLYFAPQVTEVTSKERPPLYFAPQVTDVTSNLPKNSEVIYHPKPAHFHEPSILNLSLSKASETFHDQQSDVLDLSTKQVAFSNFSEPEKQTVDVSETLEDTHQTRVKSLTPPDSPESTPSSSPTPRQQPYSPTMPYYNPGSIGAVPEYTPTMRDELPTVGFPPKPIALSHTRSRDRYSYLLHDPRTLFAGAPSTFQKDEDSKYADRLRRKALQIGVRPENLSFCADGQSITRTEFVQQGDFIYKLTSTLTPIPKPTRLRDRSVQTETDDHPRCRSGCPGCGMVFVCNKD